MKIYVDSLTEGLFKYLEETNIEKYNYPESLVKDIEDLIRCDYYPIRYLFAILMVCGSDLEILINDFDELSEEFRKRSNRGRFRRFLDSDKDQNSLVQFKARIDEAVNVLQVGSSS